MKPTPWKRSSWKRAKSFQSPACWRLKGLCCSNILYLVTKHVCWHSTIALYFYPLFNVILPSLDYTLLTTQEHHSLLLLTLHYALHPALYCLTPADWMGEESDENICSHLSYFQKKDEKSWSWGIVVEKPNPVIPMFPLRKWKFTPLLRPPVCRQCCLYHPPKPLLHGHHCRQHQAGEHRGFRGQTDRHSMCCLSQGSLWSVWFRLVCLPPWAAPPPSPCSCSPWTW